jgi:hypothetical protein
MYQALPDKAPTKRNVGGAEEKMDETPPLVAPVWWDPKRRKVVWDGSSYIAGILVAAPDRFAIINSGGTVAEGSLIGASSAWPSLQRRAGAPVLDVVLADGTLHKIWFTHPHRAAPRLSKEQSDEIAEMIEKLGDVGDKGNAVATALGASNLPDIGDFASIAADGIRSIAGFVEQKHGRTNLHQFQSLLDHP